MKNVDQNKSSVSNLLKEILADQFLLYTKSRNYHWNVVGANFYGLHKAFEDIYEGLAEDIDNIAERIRALGSNAPGTLKEFQKLSSIKETENNYPSSTEMVKEIINDLEYISSKLNSSAKKIQDENSDEVTAGMLYSLLEKYDKTLWMLKSTLA